MKKYPVASLASKNSGEYVLGSAELNTHACYLVYGILKAGESDRLVSPGKGHEEILCLISGEVELTGEDGGTVLRKGEALHLRGDDRYLMSNNSGEDIVYVISGGHNEIHSH